jgi:hypothetical protein
VRPLKLGPLVQYILGVSTTFTGLIMEGGKTVTIDPGGTWRAVTIFILTGVLMASLVRYVLGRRFVATFGYYIESNSSPKEIMTRFSSQGPDFPPIGTKKKCSHRSHCVAFERLGGSFGPSLPAVRLSGGNMPAQRLPCPCARRPDSRDAPPTP